MDLYDKGANTLPLWLPIKREGEWTDFYTNRVMENYSQPWAGDISQNCAHLIDGDNWGGNACDYPYYACMCEHKPSVYLALKGLCPYSEIDTYFKPITDLMDSRKLLFQGL